MERGNLEQSDDGVSETEMVMTWKKTPGGELMRRRIYGQSSNR
jgi:hypothetical protein